MSSNWKKAPKPPRFLTRAVASGLKIADCIGIEKADDKSWLRITFRKFRKLPPAQR